ncbi:IS200/IS605 family transposase, partial [Limosilactobacillus fermentum]
FSVEPFFYFVLHFNCKFAVADDNDIVIEKMEVMPDHIHMLISFPPSKAPASAIKALKGRSAYIFLQNHPEIRCSQYWGGHLWSPSYYMSTLGNMSKEVVEKYINDPKYTETNKKPHKGAQ